MKTDKVSASNAIDLLWWFTAHSYIQATSAIIAVTLDCLLLFSRPNKNFGNGRYIDLNQTFTSSNTIQYNNFIKTSDKPQTNLQALNVNKKAQLSLTNPRDAKACQKLLQFDVLTALSLTILAYLHAFSCCCVRNLRNPEKFTENSNL